MAAPLRRVRTVALSYAILGTMYIVIIAMLGVALWTGSWLRLWHDLADTPHSALTGVGALAAVNASMAGLAFWYLSLSRLFRVITLAASLILSVLAVAGAISVLVQRHAVVAPVSIPTLIVAKSLVALGYC